MICATFGCWIFEAIAASSRNICSNVGSSERLGRIVLIATVFENPREPRERATQTVAIPPEAMGSSNS